MSTFTIKLGLDITYNKAIDRGFVSAILSNFVKQTVFVKSAI